MKNRSIRSKLGAILLLADAAMIVLIVLAAFGMRSIRDDAVGAMTVAIETVESGNGASEDVADFINPEISELNILASKYIFAGIIVAAVCGLLLTGYIYLVRKEIVGNLNHLEDFANELSRGNLVARVDASEKRKDEFGRLNKAFYKMIEWYDSTIGFVKKESLKINSNVNDMTNSIGTLNDNIENVAATAEELSATMEEMAVSLSNITQTVNEIDNASKGVAERSQEGAETAVEIKERASVTRKKMEETQGKLEVVHAEISEGLERALEQIQIVSRIGTLSDSIMDITSQTTLLSLNASIEAARAGEAGKGFAVVANEIQKLAEQSRQSVSDIQTIISSVAEAVDELSGNAKQLLDFVSNDVRDSFEDFMEMAVAYNNDADNVNSMVMDYSAISEELSASIESVTEELSRINEATTECAKASSEIAVMNTNIGVMSSNTRNAAEDTNDISNELQKVVDEFAITE